MATIQEPPFPNLADLPNPGRTDQPYVNDQITAAFAHRQFPPYVPSSSDMDYWSGKATHYDTFSDGQRRIGWNAYWEYRILITDTPFDQGGGGGGSSSGIPTNDNPNGYLLTPQLGFLEDDFAYRLALLCVNVLQPLKNRYPNIVVVSGFRQTNAGIGQHELGEAVDIQIRNQSNTLLYEVADYIQKFLNFDQLILNFTTIGDGQGWIHVSFSGKSLRSQVLTKDFADNFHEGLFLVTPLSGEAAAQVIRDNATADAAILAELHNIQLRQQRLDQRPPSVTPTRDDTTVIPEVGPDANGTFIPVVTTSFGPSIDVIHSTSTKYPVLLGVFGSDDEARTAADQFLRRIIWRLQQQHIQAARQREPNGTISFDKLCIFIDGTWHVFAVVTLGLAGQATTIDINELAGPNPVADGGIAD